MPTPSKGPRLWRRKERRDGRGRITHPSIYVIRDGIHQESTGCGRDDRLGAERCLEAYLNRKHLAAANKGARDPVLMRYKPKSIAALHIALGGLPDKVRVEVDRGIGVSKDRWRASEMTAWPENLVITIRQARALKALRGRPCLTETVAR